MPRLTKSRWQIGRPPTRIALAGVMLLAVALAARGRVAPAAADPAVDEDAGTATVIRLFVPWLPNGTLNPALTVSRRETLEGNPNTQTTCQVNALATTRPDAWRCVTADPCFEPPFGSSDFRVVACSNGPWLNEVVVLDLGFALPSPTACRDIPGCRPQLDLTRQPWALELGNGARCLPLLGTSGFVAGMRINWTCASADGAARGDAIGTVDRGGAAWQAFYLPENGYVVDRVDVRVAWY